MASYWRRVFARTWREAAKAVGLETGQRVIVALLIQAIISVGLWFALNGTMPAGTIWTRALTAAAPFLLLPLLFLWRFPRVPPAMAREDAAAIAALEAARVSQQPPEDDTDLIDGLSYVLNGAWGGELWDGDALTPVHEAAERIRKAAFRRRIHVWGQRARRLLHEDIPSDFWSHTGLDLVALTKGEARTETEGVRSERWFNLRVNRAEFEREFCARSV